MRCPKCAESFQVHRDGSVAKAGGGTAPAATKPKRRKPTQVGLGPSVSSAVQPPNPAADDDDTDAIDLPKPMAPAGGIDLPAPLADADFADLPAPKAGADSLDFDPFDVGGVEDLPAPKGSPSRQSPNEPASSGFDPFADMDLPAPYEGPSGGTDLPAPLSSRGASDIDLPTPMTGGQARAVQPSFDEVDLPMAMTDAELPKPMASADSIPEPISLDSDLPVALDEQDLPVARDDFAEIEGPDRVHGGGPIELDLPDGGDLDLEMDFGGPAPVAPQPPPIGGIGTPVGSPGEAPVGEAPPSRDSAELDLPESDELEFSELGSSDDVVHMPHPGGARPEVSMAPDRPKRRTAMKRPPWLMKALVAIVVLCVIAGAGFYSGTTKYGLFGVHLVEPFLPGSGDEVSVTQAIESAELEASADTYGATKAAMANLAAARTEANLNRTLAARDLLHESYFQIRYGQDAQSGTTADGLRLFLQRRGDEAPRVHVALAADALRTGDTMTTSSELTAAAAEDPTDTYVDLVQGEAALKSRDGKGAVEAFGRAFAKHESARAQWGLARGHALLGNTDEAKAAAAATLEASPLHAGARIAVATSFISDGQFDDAAALLRAPAGVEPVDGKTLDVARSDKSKALTLLASIEEQGGRLGAAREMYEKAIELDSSNSPAALGAARLVLLEGVYPDALARFRTVLGSPVPPGAEVDATGKPRMAVEAKLGAAEALLAMDKADEAKKILLDLDTPEPVSANVEVWLGKVADALGETENAVRHFRNAIKLDESDVRAYIALAQHYADTRRPDQAVAVLVEAQRNVEITAEVRRLLGWAQLQRGNLDAAIEQFEAAVAEEPRDSASVFGLAQAYRRKRMFDEAASALDKVEELDNKFPTLQLERGRLAEAKGDTAAAIAGYQAALAETPDDIALKSRLGAALVLTGQLEEAEQLLREVLKAQPYSAESEHYLGRIEFQRGEIEASRVRFARAARLDPESGMYRMYVGWAALESNEMTPALRELESAIKLDPNVGDAYWLRARIRIRAGTVRDALADLERAIELNPNRIDAWAAMGECHYQLGQTKEAVRDFEKAVAGAPENAYWWYRLGRLQLDEGLRAKALTSLSNSVSLGDDTPSKHGWLADAHRLIGDIYYAKKKRKDAVIEYGRYLELADPDAIDRADVENKVRRISQGRD
jgi:tetratricopeptide (TPR) repeat protein